MHDAKPFLLKKGLSTHEADAALHLVEERSDRSGSIPSSAKYFEVAGLAAWEDPRDNAEIVRRAERRARFMPAAEQLAMDNERESQASGRSIREVVETRSRAASAGRSR